MSSRKARTTQGNPVSIPPPHTHPEKEKEKENKETMVVHHQAGTQIFPNLKQFYKGLTYFYFIFDYLYVCIIYMCLVQEQYLRKGGISWRWICG